MKIRYMSDLHIEFPWVTTDWVPSIGEDVVVLAGDIGTGVRGIEWAVHAFRGRPVVYVLGNHEFYRAGWDSLIVQARTAAAGTHVHVLEDDAVDIGGVRFLGATLWTDFELYGKERRIASMIAGRDALVDFQLIAGTDGYSLTPQATIDRHERSRAWLTREIAASTLPVVVVTHHSPSKANEHPEFVGKELGPCFHSKLDELFRPPVRAWISGHNHYSCVTQVNGIPLVSNQRGYPREGVRFSWEAMIEVSDRGSPMNLRAISTEAEYRDTLREIETLMSAEAGTEAGERLKVLAALVDEYEHTNFQMTSIERARQDLRLDLILAEQGREIVELDAKGDLPVPPSQ